jgi:hypothetical protein
VPSGSEVSPPADPKQRHRRWLRRYLAAGTLLLLSPALVSLVRPYAVEIGEDRWYLGERFYGDPQGLHYRRYGTRRVGDESWSVTLGAWGIGAVHLWNHDDPRELFFTLKWR